MQGGDDDLIYLAAFAPLMAVLGLVYGPVPPLMVCCWLLFGFEKKDLYEPVRMLKTPRKTHEQVFDTSNMTALAYAPLMLSLTVFYVS